MKKLFVITIISAIGFVFIAQNSFGFGVPSVTGSKTEKVTKSVVGDVVKSAVVDDLNKELAAQNCQCNLQTGDVTGCDVAAIGKKIDNKRKPLKIALNRSIKFYVRTAYAPCSHKFTTAYKTSYSYWYGWYTPIDKSLGKSVKLWVK